MCLPPNLDTIDYRLDLLVDLSVEVWQGLVPVVMEELVVLEEALDRSNCK